MRNPQDRQITAQEKNIRRRRKKVRCYTILACRKDDPSDLYGVMFYTARKGMRAKPVAVKGHAVFRTVVSKLEYGVDVAQEAWNTARGVIRKITAWGRVKTRIKHVAKPPALPQFPGTCYETVKTEVEAPYDKMRIGYIDDKNKIRYKRMRLEDFRFFVARIGSKSCPIEFSPEGDRKIKALMYGYKTLAAASNKLCLKFSVKKDFDFKWGGGRNASASLTRRDHELGSVGSEAQVGSHKPVNPVALDVNVLRKPGVQNFGSDEMRKDASPKRSGSEEDTKASDRNSESAALS